MKLAQKTAVITGASRGIGWALAQALARRKCHLILTARKFPAQVAEELKKQGASSVELVTADLSTVAGQDDLIKKLKTKTIDILINNAGLLTGGLLEEQNDQEVIDLLQVNVTALIRLTRSLLPQLLSRPEAKIVNHASVSGIMYFPCSSVYSASKAAVIAFTKSLDEELRKTRASTLTLVTPGIDTDMFRDIPNRFGKNLNTKFLSQGLDPAIYAERVCRAMECDTKVLKPTGAMRLFLWMASHTPSIFYGIARSQFHRSDYLPKSGDTK